MIYKNKYRKHPEDISWFCISFKWGFRKSILKTSRAFVRMYPRAKKYGLKYYTSYNFRRKCRSKEEAAANDKKYGKAFLRKRKSTRVALTARDGMSCRHCLLVNTQLTIDHVMPLWAGGTNDLKNLQLLCTRCHRKKTVREEKERQKISSRKALKEKAMGALQATHSS